MDTKKLTQLAMARRKLDAQVKERSEELSEELKPLKEKIGKVDQVLAKVINKSGEEGTLKNFTLPDKSTVYASEVEKYSTRDRTELDQWVLEPLTLYLDIESDLLGDEAAEALADLVKALNEVQDRMGIFSNTIVKDSAIRFRKDTGASEIEGDLKGGKLPGGVRVYKEAKVNFRKGS